jgi:hypothetical protein
VACGASYDLLPENDDAPETACRRKRGAAEQGDEADEAGASDGASQLIPGVRRTIWASEAAGDAEVRARGPAVTSQSAQWRQVVLGAKPIRRVSRHASIAALQTLSVPHAALPERGLNHA